MQTQENKSRWLSPREQVRSNRYDPLHQGIGTQIPTRSGRWTLCDAKGGRVSWMAGPACIPRLAAWRRIAAFHGAETGPQKALAQARVTKERKKQHVHIPRRPWYASFKATRLRILRSTQRGTVVGTLLVLPLAGQFVSKRDRHRRTQLPAPVRGSGGVAGKGI